MMDKRKRKISLRERWAYWFDNLMAKGTVALVGLLFGITVLVVVVVGVITVLLRAADLSIGESVWLSLMHTIDAGTLTADTGSLPFMALMTAVTICGMFITSVLIGIINTGMEAKMDELRKGKSCVLEEGHTVILGFAGNIYTILTELIEANANQKDGVIVVMDGEMDKEEMEDAIRQRIPDTKTTRIICRHGNITDFSDLSICSLDYCKSIIVNIENDFTTIKAILAATCLLKKSGNAEAYITALIRQRENCEAAGNAGEGRAEILYFDDTIARIVAHTCRQTGLSQVFQELFDFGGDEIYLEEIPQMAGKAMKELNRYFPVSTVMGMKKKGKVFLNPAGDTVVEEGDQLILLAEDDGVSIPGPALASVDEESIRHGPAKEQEPPQRMLILGYGERLGKILAEEDIYMARGSEITVALQEESEEMAADILNQEFQNVDVKFRFCNIYQKGNLEMLLSWEPESVLVLSPATEDEESDDAKTLLLLLQLRTLAREKGFTFAVTSEMRRVENQELTQVTGVKDFVVSSNITSLMLTQISQSRELKEIFEELLTEEGSELYMLPAEDYVALGRPVNMYTAGEAAARRDQVMVGYRKADDDNQYKIITNPAKESMVTFEKGDRFIVLSEE